MDAVDALRAGRPVLLPTDGVYGLCCALEEAAALRLYEVKGRAGGQPTAIIGASLEALLALIPELDTSLVLPGPFTCVVPNPAHRFRWLAGETPDAIGLRLPELPPATQRVLDAVGAVAATSANEPGDPPAVSIDEVAPRIRAACGAEIDGGRLSGTPSTVVDLTGPTPVVLRQGAGELP
jgi:tRNA threonylcarbamoyl adenosine modification protein (Sua5/YciO/YrdC/YwlC family)